MESLNLYSPCQHGFRKNRSCVTQLLEVIPFCISMCKYAVTSNESRSSLVIFFFFLISCLTHHRVSTDNWLLFPLWCYGFSNFNEEIILSKKFLKLPKICEEGRETRSVLIAQPGEHIHQYQPSRI